ncbi:MAG: hypothetical protein MUE82_00770 [Chloroflexi bacterium]|nr:hypothetical protein [Chloroflexota bacterium]
MTWAVLGVALVAFALALVPTRRLYLAGWRPAPLAVYLAVLVALAVVAVLFRAGTRAVIPALLVLYVLPFIGAPEAVARTVARLGRGRSPRIVDGRATAVPDQPADDEAGVAAGTDDAGGAGGAGDAGDASGGSGGAGDASGGSGGASGGA